MSIISKLLHLTDEERCRFVMINYGEVLIAMEHYKKRYDADPKDQYAYKDYKEQLTLIDNLEAYIKQMAKEMAIDANL